MQLRALRGRFPVFLCIVALLASACTLPTSDEPNTETITGEPSVQIVSPLTNATYLSGVSVNIQAVISNAAPNVVEVIIEVDGGEIGAHPAPINSNVFSVTQSWPITEVGQHTIVVTAQNAEDVAVASNTVNITVVDESEANTSQDGVTPAATQEPTDANSQTQPTTQPTTQVQPTRDAAPQTQPTQAPANTQAPPPTASRPMARIVSGVNVRSGPGVAFNPPIGSLAANTDVELLGVNPARDWYKIRYYNGEGWIYAPNATTSGDTGSLPVDPGPATPAPTAIPLPTETPVPASAINLTIDATKTSISPHPFTCAQDSEFTITIVNNGTQASPGGSILIQDILVSTNGVLESTTGGFGPIEPGQSVTISQIFLRVNTNYLVEHRTVITIDSANQIAETNENDNTNVSTYILLQGACP